VRSSRAIEGACVEDVAYRVIAAQTKPDHATIARFVERHQAALAGVFGAVLGLCAKAGLVGVKVVAVDGSKVSGNASRAVNVDYERLAREVLQDHRAVDAAEDERFGDRRGDGDAALHSCERDICIDLSQVRFIDASGLHVLLHAHRMLNCDRRRLTIITPPGPVLRTLETIHLDAVLPLFADRTAAHRST
jgi:ABC-type transporter Mla MlaB component